MTPDGIDRGDARKHRSFLLTARQIEVLTLAAHGRTRFEMARKLGITSATVNRHLCLAMRTLGAWNTTHAVALALHHNLIELDT